MMKKLLVLFCVFYFSVVLYAQNDFFIKFFSQRIDISVQEDDTQKYYDGDIIPELLYGSKIISNGMAVVSVFDSEFLLKKGQGILISKDPITGELLVYKIDSSKDDKIAVTLNKYITTELKQDNIFSFSKLGRTIKLKLLCGDSTLVENGKSTTIHAGDFLYYKKLGD